MSSKRQSDYLPVFAGSLYYSKKEFQFPIHASVISVRRDTVLRHLSGITLLFVKSGQGKISINTREYSLHHGVLLCLGAYHYFQIKPDPESPEPLEVAQCRLSYDAFLYMAANPYYRFSQITLNAEPLTSVLSGEMLKRGESVVDELVQVSSRHNQMGGEREFFLCMRLMGIMQKTCQKKTRESMHLIG